MNAGAKSSSLSGGNVVAGMTQNMQMSAKTLRNAPDTMCVALTLNLPMECHGYRNASALPEKGSADGIDAIITS
jgi:hypothetical protein